MFLKKNIVVHQKRDINKTSCFEYTDHLRCVFNHDFDMFDKDRSFSMIEFPKINW